MDKFDYVIAVFTWRGKEKGYTTKFVTGTNGTMALWEAGKPAKRFPKGVARDIVYGLTVNGFTAAVVTTFAGVTTFVNPA